MITADIVDAGKLRVGVGIGAASIALKDASSGDLRGAAIDLGRDLVLQIGVETAFVEYPRSGVVKADTPNSTARQQKSAGVCHG